MIELNGNTRLASVGSLSECRTEQRATFRGVLDTVRITYVYV
jgi:hypothetical protein